MEVNLENAFSVILGVTYGIFIPYIDNVYNKVAEFCHNSIKWLLKRPLLSTIVSASVFVTISGIVTFSVIVVLGVGCIVSSIILFEGLIFVAVVLVAVSLIIILLALAISFYIVRRSYSVSGSHSGEEFEDFGVFL